MPELQKEIISTKSPPEDVGSDIYNPLIMESLKRKYVGVRNEYLSEQISAMLEHNVTVKGGVEKLALCPCCSYRILKDRGRICPSVFGRIVGMI